MSNRAVRRAIQLGMVILFAGTAAISSQLDPNFAQAQRLNAQELRQYTWKARTEIRKDGETKNIQLNLMRYDIHGMLQKTPISATPQQQLPTRGLRGKIAHKKKEDFVETLGGLETLAKSYGELPPDKMQRFIATATMTPEMTQQQKLFRITGRDVLQPGDSMSVWVDMVTHKTRRVEVQTTLDNSLVRVVSEFRDLPQGPTYMARSVIDYPSEHLTLTTENFDYERVAR
jgi:hypothetical protein